MNTAYTALEVAYKALQDVTNLRDNADLFPFYIGIRNLQFKLGVTFGAKSIESEPDSSPRRTLEELLCEAVDKAESVTLTMNRAGATVQTFSTPFEVSKPTVRSALTVLLRKLRSAA